jgi:hypothetical protein
MKESHPLANATLLAILASAAHIPTLYPVGACQGACAVAPTTAEFATTAHQITATNSLSSPGLAAVHGPAQARSVTFSHATTVSATQLSHSLSHLHQGALRVPLVLLQEPQAQS